MKIHGKILSRYKKYLLRKRGAKIGNNTYISHHCFIDTKGQLEIADNVFIGVNSVVMMNTQIGDNATIGASSVVTKEVKPNTTYINR